MIEIALIGKKIGMTREFYKTGQLVPVTVLKVEKARVIQVIEVEKRGYKAVVRREVVRLVTPGTITEDNLLDAKKSNYLASYSLVHEEASVSWIDISTGSFYISSIKPERLASELTRLSPSEILLSEDLAKAHRDLAEEFGVSVTELGNSAFESS